MPPLHMISFELTFSIGCFKVRLVAYEVNMSVRSTEVEADLRRYNPVHGCLRYDLRSLHSHKAPGRLCAHSLR